MASANHEADSEGRAHASVAAVGEAEVTGRFGAGHQEDRAAHRSPRSRSIGGAEREGLVDEARNVEFPIALRGYERSSVDRYVQRVNRLVAELEISSFPESAVRHALAEASEEAGEVLRRGHQTADEVVARCRAEAEAMLEQAARDARETLEAAQVAAKETREAARREARELRDTTARDATGVRETARREATELRETTVRQLAELREAALQQIEQLRAAAQSEADELRAGARRRSDEMLESAETRSLELARDAEAMWRECRRLIEDARVAGEQLIAIGRRTSFPHVPEELMLVDDHRRERTANRKRADGDAARGAERLGLGGEQAPAKSQR